MFTKAVFSFLFMCFFAFDSFFFIMKHRSDDPIGGPAPLPRMQLPTYRDVARQWRQTRVDMQSAGPGVVVNREVAKKVNLCNRGHQNSRLLAFLFY